MHIQASQRLKTSKIHKIYRQSGLFRMPWDGTNCMISIENRVIRRTTTYTSITLLSFIPRHLLSSVHPYRLGLRTPRPTSGLTLTSQQPRWPPLGCSSYGSTRYGPRTVTRNGRQHNTYRSGCLSLTRIRAHVFGRDAANHINFPYKGSAL